MAVNIGPKIGIDGEAEYRRQIQNIIQQTKTLKSETEALKSSFDKSGGSIKQNKEYQKLLKEQIEAQKSKVSELNSMLEQSSAKYGENDTKTLKWKQAVADATAELNRMEAELKEIPSSLDVVGSKMQDVGGKISSVGDKMTGIGTKMTVAVTAPVVAGAKQMVESYADVDKTMTLANKTMGNSAEEAKMLEDAMAKAAANSTFGMSDAATASLNFARAGLDATQAANALAPAMNLAAGEGGDLDTVSGGLVATINGFHGSFEEAAHYADVFAAGCNNSALDVNSLSDAMSVAAPVFSAAGYAVEDATLYMGLMANAGIDANVAANSLKTGLARLISPAKSGAEAMEKCGISANYADGTMKDTTTLLFDLKDAFSGMSEAEQVAAASAIFGKNQMAPWLALINSSVDDINALSIELDGASINTEAFAEKLSESGKSVDDMKSNLSEFGVSSEAFDDALKLSGGDAQLFAETLLEWSDAGTTSEDVINALGGDLTELQGIMDNTSGTTDEMAEAMMGGFGGSIEKLNSSLDVLKTTTGGLLAEYLQPVIDKAQEWVDKFQEMDDGTKKIIITVAGIAAAIGPALVVLGTLTSSVGSIISTGGQLLPLMGKLGGGIATIGAKALAALPGVISFMAPFLPFILIAAAVVAAGVLIYKNWDKIKEAAGKLGSFISEKWEGIKSATTEKWEAVKSTVSEKWNGIKEKTSTVLDATKSKTQSDLANIKQKFDENGGGIKGITAAAWEGIKTYYRNGFSVLNTLTGGKLGEIARAFTNKFTEIKNNALNWGRDIIQNLVNGINNMIGKVKEAAQNVAQAIADFLHFSEPDKGPLSKFHTFMPDMMSQLSKGMLENLGEVEMASAQVAEAVAGNMSSNSYNYGGFNIIINGTSGQTATELADIIEDRINAKMASQKAVWGTI